jgi:hypothetical protein
MGQVINIDDYRKSVEETSYEFHYIDGYTDEVSLEDFQQVSTTSRGVWIHYFGPGGQVEAPKI